MTTEAAEWREVVQGKVYALYVHKHHRVALAQTNEEGVWVVTMPDDPGTKHPAKDQADAFRIGRKISITWLKAALEQLNKDTAPKAMSQEDAAKEARDRTRMTPYGKNRKVSA